MECDGLTGSPVLLSCCLLGLCVQELIHTRNLRESNAASASTMCALSYCFSWFMTMGRTKQFLELVFSFAVSFFQT